MIKRNKQISLTIIDKNFFKNWITDLNVLKTKTIVKYKINSDNSNNIKKLDKKKHEWNKILILIVKLSMKFMTIAWCSIDKVV